MLTREHRFINIVTKLLITYIKYKMISLLMNRYLRKDSIIRSCNQPFPICWARRRYAGH